MGDDDGGKLFTPEEYEQYKKRVLPMVSIDLFDFELKILNYTKRKMINQYLR